MKTRTIVLTLALCFVGVAVCFAADANMGTWKLNEAKSKLSPGTPKNTTVVYMAAGDNVMAMVKYLSLSRLIRSLGLLLNLFELLWRLAAGFANGLAAGYLSHLALDAVTPRSIPLLKTGF